MDEYEKLEEDLQKMYGEYMCKFKNQAYLETLMEEYNQAEQTKSEVRQRIKHRKCAVQLLYFSFCFLQDIGQHLRKLQEKIAEKAETMETMAGEVDSDEEFGEARPIKYGTSQAKTKTFKYCHVSSGLHVYFYALFISL